MHDIMNYVDSVEDKANTFHLNGLYKLKFITIAYYSNIICRLAKLSLQSLGHLCLVNKKMSEIDHYFCHYLCTSSSCIINPGLDNHASKKLKDT